MTLFFLFGAYLPDPNKLLDGSGKYVRQIRLKTAADLDSPPIRDLISKALEMADPTIDNTRPGRLWIKSVSPKQRPRR